VISLNATLFIQVLNFLVALALLNGLIIRPIREVMARRRAQNDALRGDSDSLNRDAARKREDYEARLAGTREEAAAGVVRARREGEEAARGRLEKAEGEARAVRADAAALLSRESGDAARILGGKTADYARMALGKLLAACLFVAAATAPALASGEEHSLPWGDFALRVLNLVVVAGILWYAAGAMIKKYFFGRRERIVREMADLENLRREAAARLAEADSRVAGVEAECAALLEEGRARAESVRAAVLAEAERQAAGIVEQARQGAEQEARAELAALRARLADEIVAAMRAEIEERLDTAGHQKLIDKSLAKVVLP
jgi:F-type H+-transporting ATPase subunit b